LQLLVYFTHILDFDENAGQGAVGLSVFSIGCANRPSDPAAIVANVVIPTFLRWEDFGETFAPGAQHPRGDRMAFPTSVNDQITDSVTQANTKVLGDAPAVALGNLYQATAQALANAAHNATNAQQQSYVTAQSATTMGVATLYSLDTATTGVATKEILSTGVKGLGN
jgi:hypothetical protein